MIVAEEKCWSKRLMGDGDLTRVRCSYVYNLGPQQKP